MIPQTNEERKKETNKHFTKNVTSSLFCGSALHILLRKASMIIHSWVPLFGLTKSAKLETDCVHEEAIYVSLSRLLSFMALSTCRYPAVHIAMFATRLRSYQVQFFHRNIERIQCSQAYWFLLHFIFLSLLWGSWGGGLIGISAITMVWTLRCRSCIASLVWFVSRVYWVEFVEEFLIAFL